MKIFWKTQKLAHSFMTQVGPNKAIAKVRSGKKIITYKNRIILTFVSFSCCLLYNLDKFHLYIKRASRHNQIWDVSRI